MLHYLSSGKRDYHAKQIGISVRSGWEFQAVVSGKMAPSYPSPEGTDSSYKKRHLWIFTPGVPHGWLSPPGQNCRIVVAHVDTEDIPPLLVQTCQETGVLDRALTGNDVKRIEDLTADLKQHYPRLTKLTGLYTQRLITELCTIALRDQNLPVGDWTQRYNEQRVRVAMTWFSQNMNQHVGVEEMAQATGLSPAHLRRLFAQTRNESPLQAINQLRLERARHLLRDSELAVAEIADIVGMSGPTVFCRWYKTATGYTPLEHRKRMRMEVE